MKNKLIIIGIVCLVAGSLASVALAVPCGRCETGPVIPGEDVGFNPQPEPPVVFPEGLPSEIGHPADPIIPSDPVGPVLDFVPDPVTPSEPGEVDPASVVGFNPQPEPPGSDFEGIPSDPAVRFVPMPIMPDWSAY